MTTNFKLTLLIENDLELLNQIEQIDGSKLSLIESSHYDGDTTLIPIVITTTAIIIKQLALILVKYFDSKKQIKIVYKGMQITCNSVDEFDKIMTRLTQLDENE